MKTQNNNIAEFLKSIFNVAFSETNQFNRVSFRMWVANNVEAGTLALPAGVDECDVYEAADRY